MDTSPQLAPETITSQTSTQTTLQPTTRQSLQSFTLNDLAVYTREGEFDPDDSSDFRRFMAGRDDVHGVLMHVLTRVTISAKMSMFGFDDDEIADAIVALVVSQHVFWQGSLDNRQAAGAHEKKIIAAFPDSVRSSLAIGPSATGDILHTKGFVLDGKIGIDGSTNLSASGEGLGIGLHGAANIKGYHAQANTLTVFTNRAEVTKFSSRLDEEHLSILQRQVSKISA